MTPETRFWSRVVVQDDGCWLYAPARGNTYGRVHTGFGLVGSHRIAWILTRGQDVPPDLVVCHTCDNRACVRPDHLFVGDQATNVRDCVDKGRHGTRTQPHRTPRGSAQGLAKLTDEIVRAIRDSPLSHAAAGALHGVHKSTVKDIRRRRTWAHVP